MTGTTPGPSGTELDPRDLEIGHVILKILGRFSVGPNPGCPRWLSEFDEGDLQLFRCENRF